MRISLLFICICCFFSCEPQHDVPKRIAIHQDWEFKATTDSIWRTATVPGNVHTDLFDNTLIENPFIGDNESKLQWISETDWEYRTFFNVDDDIFNKKHLELNFEGLDTYASIYLNDSLILKANNAFREWNVDVKTFLKQAFFRAI